MKRNNKSIFATHKAIGWSGECTATTDNKTKSLLLLLLVWMLDKQNEPVWFSVPHYGRNITTKQYSGQPVDHENASYVLRLWRRYVHFGWNRFAMLVYVTVRLQRAQDLLVTFANRNYVQIVMSPACTVRLSRSVDRAHRANKKKKRKKEEQNNLRRIRVSLQ